MKESIHKITDREELRLLLQLFMDGATSLEQEAALADYFRTNEVDDEFADYRDMFLVFESGELAPTFELPAPDPIVEEKPHDAAPLPTGQKSRSRIVTNGRFLSGTIQRPTCDMPSRDARVSICNQLYVV